MMTKKATPRYSIVQIRQIREYLTDWIEQSQAAIDAECSRDYPDSDRFDALEIRIECLQGALDALEGIE